MRLPAAPDRDRRFNGEVARVPASPRYLRILAALSAVPALLVALKVGQRIFTRPPSGFGAVANPAYNADSATFAQLTSAFRSDTLGYGAVYLLIDPRQQGSIALLDFADSIMQVAREPLHIAYILFTPDSLRRVRARLDELFALACADRQNKLSDAVRSLASSGYRAPADWRDVGSKARIARLEDFTRCVRLRQSAREVGSALRLATTARANSDPVLIDDAEIDRGERRIRAKLKRLAGQ